MNLQDLTLVPSGVWDAVAVESYCPHLAAYKKADGARWSKELQRLDKRYSKEAASAILRSLKAFPFRSLADAIIDSQSTSSSNTLCGTSHNLFEVREPISIGLLTANGMGGTVLGYSAELKSSAYVKGDKKEAFIRYTREILQEPANTTEKAKPGIFMLPSEWKIEGIDAADATRLGFITPPATLMTQEQAALEHIFSRVLALHHKTPARWAAKVKSSSLHTELSNARVHQAVLDRYPFFRGLL